MTNVTRRVFLDDVRYLLRCGVDPVEIAARLGVKPETLSRVAYREADPALGSRIDRALRALKVAS